LKILLLTFVFIATLFASPTLEHVSLQLKWKYQFQFAGFIAAKEKGFYKDIGLDVDLREFDEKQNVIESLNRSEIDFAISDSSLVYQAMKGEPVVAMMALFQDSPYMLLALDSSNIKTLSDINNKKIAFFENINGRFIKAMLEATSLTYQIEPVKNKFNRLINHEVDMIGAYISNEPFRAKELGFDTTVFNPKDYGYEGYGDILFTSKQQLKENPILVQKMYEASKKGWLYAYEHKDEIVDIIYNKYNTSNKSKKALRYEADTLETLSGYQKNFGEIKKEKIKAISHLFTFMLGGKYKVASLEEFIYQYDLNALSIEEKAYLEKNKQISFTGDPNWLPFEAFDSDGNYMGIVADHLEHIEQTLDITFDKQISTTWSDAIEIAMRGDADVISGDASDAILNQKFTPIDSYLKNPIVIVEKHTNDYVDSLQEISSNKIAIIKDYGYTADIYKNYPTINFIEVENIQKALRGVEDGTYDTMLSSLALASYHISKMGLDDLAIVGKTDIVMHVTLFVSKDKPLLHSILNKTTHQLDNDVHHKILSKWRDVTTVTKMDYTLIWQIVGISSLLLLFFLFRQRTLERYNHELEKHKELYSVVFENSSNGVLILDMLSGKFTNCNQKIIEILQYSSKEDVLNLRPEELSPAFQPDGRASDEKASEMIGLAVENGSHTFEWKHIRANGEEFWAEIILTSIKLDNKDLLHVIWKDIDEKKRLELELMKHAQILEQVHDSIISTDLEGKIISWNRGSELLLNYEAKEVIGTSITDIYYEADFPTFEKIVQILKVKSLHHSSARLIKKSNDIIFADVSLSLLTDKNGKDIGIIGYSQDITQQKQAQEKLLEQKTMLDHQAHHDMLTELPNRLLFNDRLTQGIEKAKRNKSEIALFFIDLDHFKQINDSLGHDIGDKVLQVVTNRLSSQIRKGDTLSRLGGDEFTIIMEELKRSEDAALLAQKILNALVQPIHIGRHELYISSSIGISLYPKDNTNVHSLLKYADAAMYRAKDEGRNNYQFYSAEMTERAFERVVMEASLRQALKNNEFVLYYQPQIDASTQKMIGVEALIRWQHPSMGMVSPAKFIPLAEETGLIVEMDQWVMKTAMMQVSQWYKEGYFSGRLALNLAIKHLEHPDLIDELKASLNQYNFKPEWLELEVTEGDVMKRVDEAIIKLQEIYDLGIAIAIDDFGTGYSSLSYLKRLPISKLKIDQTFVHDIPEDEEDSAIVKAIIALAQSLNLTLLAEGVETQAQNDFLVEQGCSNIQGYLYARPMPVDEVEKFIKTI